VIIRRLPEQENNMWHILVKGGWMMIPLGLCSLVAVAVITERLFYFRRAKNKDRAEEVIELVRQGLTGEALGLEREKTLCGMPVMKVLFDGIAHPSKPKGAMEAAAIAEIAAMRRGLALLDTIITLSPLLGLLGTILGMINAFNVMAASGLGSPHAVTGGVAEALVCTATGISVAVTALVPYNYFLARIERQTDRMETMATRLELVLGASAGALRQLAVESRREVRA